MLRYQEALVEAVFEINGYLRMPSRSPETESFRVYFDLLAAPGNINVRAYGGDVKVVIHSSAQPEAGGRSAPRICCTCSTGSPFANADTVAEEGVPGPLRDLRPSPRGGLQEQLPVACLQVPGHAVQTRMRYEPEERKRQRIGEHLRNGFILAPYFYEKLEEYEKQHLDFRRFYDTLIDDINVRLESSRIQSVKFAERAPRPVRREARRVVQPKVSEQEKLLSQAEGLLQLGELDDARKTLERVLELGGPGTGQARYGLGRIALDEADPRLGSRAL